MSPAPRRPKLLIAALLLALSLQPLPAGALQSGLGNSPFLVAMLMMMEMFGLLDRSRDFTSIPYTTEYWNSFMPGTGMGNMGGMPGMSPWGMSSMGMSPMGMSPSGMPGMSPMGMSPSGMPGMSPMGMSPSGMPGMSPMGMSPMGQGLGVPFANPMGGMPGGMSSAGTQFPWQRAVPGQAPGAGGWVAKRVPRLDGSWETHTGGLLVVHQGRARLYTSRSDHQDLQLKLDERYVYLLPRNARQPKRYEYRVYQQHLILRDDKGDYLLLRPLRKRNTAR